MDPKTAQRLQSEMNDHVKTLQSCQTRMSSLITQRAKLLSQQHENEMVQQEFTHLRPNDNVYKLVGPVLIKQDIDEAKANVQNRLKFFKAEM